MKPLLLVACGLLAGTSVLVRAAPPALDASPKEISLAQCLQIAFDHNPSLLTASEQFLVAEGRAVKLHAILYPTVDAQAITAPATLFVQINQVFYSRATYPQLRISRLAHEQALINYQQTLNDVAFQVEQAFYNELGSRKSYELLQRYTASQAKALTAAQNLFQAGQIQKSAVMNVQVTGNLNVQHQNTALLSVAQTRFALDNLLGQELPPDTRLAGDLLSDTSKNLDPVALTQEALQNRPDLRLLESLRLSEKQQILVDLRNVYPTVGFSSNSAFSPPALGITSNFDLERNYNEPEVERQEGNTQLPLSLYFTWIVFDGGNLRGIRMSDQAQLETQDVAINALKHSIPGEVAAAVSAIRGEQDTLRLLTGGGATDELRRSAELDYQAGRIRQLDLVNLENDILTQEELRLASQIRLSEAVAALDHALGRGLQTKPTLPHP